MLPTDAKARKETPIFSGFLMYFPDAVARVAADAVKAADSEKHFDIAADIMRGGADGFASAALGAMVALQREFGSTSGAAVSGTVTSFIQAFPDASSAICGASLAGNAQHLPGTPLKWVRQKSSDHEDSAIRHLIQAGSVDSDGIRHSTKVAWRCFAALQLAIEAEREQPAEKIPFPDLAPFFEPPRVYPEPLPTMRRPRWWDEHMFRTYEFPAPLQVGPGTLASAALGEPPEAPVPFIPQLVSN